MTGRIEILATARRPGRITTHTGPDRFHYSYQLGPGRDQLRVGGLVTFELEKGHDGVAVRVRALEQHESLLAGQSGRPEVRYEGFEQKNDVRSFKFRTWRAGEENQEVIVTADLALFRKYGITIQEGPALCLRFVEGELHEPNTSQRGGCTRTLTEKEMIAHISHRRSPSKWRT
ncbi:MAG: hypothetical protein ACE15E_14390 [Acidobacteriota bacterium]